MGSKKKKNYAKKQDTATSSLHANNSSTTIILKYKKGDILNFTGTKCYSNAYDTAKEIECTPGEVEVIYTNRNGIYPYRIKGTEESSFKKIGWVSETELDKNIQLEKEFIPIEEVKVDLSLKYNKDNQPLKCIMTNSTCYLQTSKMKKPVGILWHSTGENNPFLKRYVQPSKNDENYNELIKKIGLNSYGNDLNHITRQTGVNAWVGKLDDGTITSVQTLPWKYRSWGCGRGNNGSCNDSWIQIELCESQLTDKEYFEAIYNEACDLTAYLCDIFKINPIGKVDYNGIQVPTILCHQDSYYLGLGSNHMDIYHWFKKHKKNMTTVREDVMKRLAIGTDSFKDIGAIPSGIIQVEPAYEEVEIGDEITINEDATFTSGKNIPKEILKSKDLYIKNIKNDSVDIATEKEEKTIGSILKKFITKKTKFEPYKVKINVDLLNVRAGASLAYVVTTTLKKDATVTIIDQINNWGKLQSGAGWIDLDYTIKI